ncbi:MAG: beta-lactamase family protein [Saprospiraceae bacterium]|nr:beta-lactamase family protein [Saprospiraceae bacterium]
MLANLRSTLILSWLLVNQCQGQNLFAEIDRIFSSFNQNTPGYAIGIIKDGNLIYSKGYGSANLEYKIALTDTSSFYIASLSKQFTAACIIYLKEQGKISLQDDIRNYIPEMPKYSKTITIDHLLHHTSGIREWSSLVLFQGFNPSFEDHIDNQTILRLIYQQKELNFDPGTAYKYSSSGYILLTEIIERVSGMPLKEFAKKVLFQPLGMENTLFEDNHSEVVKNRVESYRSTETGYERMLKGFDVYGDGGILTTVKDLAKWDQAFYSNVITSDFSNQMYRLGRMKGNREIDYASGLIKGKNKGLTYYQHQGGMIQFDSYMIRYPQKQFSVIVLSNSWSNPYSGYIAGKIADLFLSKDYEITDNPIIIEPIQVDSHHLKQYAGYFWNLEDNYYNLISYRNDSLFFDNTEGFVEYLVPIALNTFQLKNHSSRIIFENNNTIMHYTDSTLNNVEMTFEKYNPGSPKSMSALKNYSGEYFSEELQTWYRFFITNEAFFLKINNNSPIKLWPEHGPRVRWNTPSKVWIGFVGINFLDRSTLILGDSRVKRVDLHKQ